MQPPPLASDQRDQKHIVPLDATEVGVNCHLPVCGHALNSTQTLWHHSPTPPHWLVERKTRRMGGSKPKYTNYFGHLTFLKICGSKMLSLPFGSKL